MSDIFYSEIDLYLRNELNARASSGQNRTTADIQYMVEKVANVTIVPYKTPDKKEIITKGIIGGDLVTKGNFLPNDGYLDSAIRPLNRVPPYISSAEIAIGDHSMGLLNTATLRINIPDPKRDLDLIEAVYFRPGRAIEMTIQHPSSACILGNTGLTGTTLESLAKIEKLYPQFARPADFDAKFRQLNKVVFDGLVTTFDFSYNDDLSVTATLSMRGTSNVYTDLSLIMNEEPKNGKPDNKEKPDPNTITVKDTFYSNLLNQFNDRQAESITKIKSCLQNTTKPAPEYAGVCTYNSEKYTAKQTKLATGVFGQPSDQQPQLQRYITLGWLIEYVNEVIMTKLTEGKGNEDGFIPSAYIIFNEDVVKSTYYDPQYFVSSNPIEVFFPSKQNRTYAKTEGDPLIWYKKINDLDTLLFATTDGTNNVYTPVSIMINLEVIKTIYDDLVKAKTFTISAFLNAVSDKVAQVSGNAISLKLVTHPENSKFLLWYDEKYIKKPGPAPYQVPMASNNNRGQLVREFSFSGKLPDSAAHLSYALNQDISSLSESDIAPYLAYMYSINDNPENVDLGISEAISKVNVNKFNENYTKTYNDYVTQLKETISKFAGDSNNTDNINSLIEALGRYVKFPTPDIKKTNEFAAPIIPFDTEFTIDGINGLRYGDVLVFDVLPSRYVRNTVFSIINITHTVDNTGVWTTKVRSIMRPKFD